MTNVNNINIAMAMKTIAGLVSLILGCKARIVWGQGASCRQDGTITLPRPKVGDADEISCMTRQALHEAGHKEHSDFSGFHELSPEVLALVNALEDPRMEREQIKKFKGGGLILNRGLEGMLKLIDEKLEANNPEHAAELVVLNVLLKGYLKVAPHRAVVETSAELVAKGDQVLGEKGTASVNAAVEKLVMCQSTGDVNILASWLFAELNAAEPETPEQEAALPSEEAGDSAGEPQGDTKQGQQGGASDESPEQQSEDASTDAASDDRSASEGGQPPKQEPESAPEAAGSENPQPGQPDGSANDDASDIAAGSGGEGSQAIDGPNSRSEAGQGDAQEEAQSGANPAAGKPKPDLSSAKCNDLGKLLEEAYAEKYGQPDIAGPEAGEEVTESQEEVTQALALALAQADDKGESLEQALEQANRLIADAHTNDQDGPSKEDQSGGAGAGPGNGAGEPVKLDFDVRLNGVVSRLVRVFTKELQDKRRRPVKYAQAGGQIAGNRVWRLKRLGDTNVFRVRAPVTGIDAAAMILLDRSGSMKADIVHASEVAVACAQALERISKVKTSIEMFPGPVDGRGPYTSTLQKFGESARQVTKRIDQIDANGGTPLTQAMQEVVPRLLAQRAQKHLLLIVSDGAPYNRSAARAEIESARCLGIDVMGIGIGPDGQVMQELVPYSVCIGATSDLPDALEKLFSGQLALKLAA